ncbi:MAG: hypothetical protein IT555_12660 [Acetobacteraceae bacterium]|nr:hypothetical protein [Acetobacteraceae bacterium]
MFFFEKKNQKTFIRYPGSTAITNDQKSFCFFFFRKRRPFLALGASRARPRSNPGPPLNHAAINPDPVSPAEEARLLEAMANVLTGKLTNAEPWTLAWDAERLR